MQIGKAIGDVTVGSPCSRKDNLRDRLAELRSAMRRSVASKALQPELHRLVEAELSEVDAYLETGDEERRGKMLMALKKAKGLLGDFADLASIAALALAVGQGLSS
ncbi:hypothetical protein [Nonomuraea sp. NPDC050783]|uniref:hypothetical protein n=1 Tax=Nonomuraea sp. NPDC050783 TaxID=3154634 RepID=UPI0034665A91